jgi:uncharacterized protein (TIGR02757 family)
LTAESRKLKGLLEKLYAKYNHRRFIPPDPLQFVYRYQNPADQELVGFLSAILAYGRVSQIQKNLQQLLAPMGASPRLFLEHFSSRDRKLLGSFKHRFTTAEHIADLLGLLQRILGCTGSIERFFCLSCRSRDENILPALTDFCNRLYASYEKCYRRPVSRQMRFLLAAPGPGPAKRLNLFLRWMVRKDNVDPGLWHSIDKRKLIVPVDVHIARLCRHLSFCRQKNISLTMAVRITRRFTELSPSDPVKYDFALTRLGILNRCSRRPQQGCSDCELFACCRPANLAARPRIP